MVANQETQGVRVPSPLYTALDNRGQPSGCLASPRTLTWPQVWPPPPKTWGNQNHRIRRIAIAISTLRTRRTPVVASLTSARLILTNCACGKLRSPSHVAPREPIRREDLTAAPPPPGSQASDRPLLHKLREGKGEVDARAAARPSPPPSEQPIAGQTPGARTVPGV